MPGVSGVLFIRRRNVAGLPCRSRQTQPDRFPVADCSARQTFAI